MKILFVSAEVAPFAKVGGLADVAGSLPKALRALGHDVRIVMPLYRMIDEDPRWKLETKLDQFDVQMNPTWAKPAILKSTEHDGLTVDFIGTDEWFTDTVDSETIYQPGGIQHLFFSAAILQMISLIDWKPDVIHCNDWHTGFLPVLMREKYRERYADTASVFTIHNFAYQGEFGLEILDAVGLSHDLFVPEKLETWGRVNFLKSGCVYADQVNTVSETYAKEIQTPEFGCTLDGLMGHLHDEHRLRGILNGIDTEVFNPATDKELAADYSNADPSGKAKCRQALLAELELPQIEGAPLFGMVTRISSQKGLDLMLGAAQSIFKLPAQIVVQGLGDPTMGEAMRELERNNPENFRYIQRFDAALAQRIYAGCDGFLMPSAFEPCGLGQMIAMRYGTVPIVRKTGGLADTVFEGHNGFVFERQSPTEFLAAVTRAVEAFQNGDEWAELIRAGMSTDVSWDLSAQRYFGMYRDALHGRRVALASPA